MRYLQFIGLTLLAAALAYASSVQASSPQGGQTGNTAPDTTFVFSPQVQGGVLITSPDAEVTVNVWNDGGYVTMTLTGNSAVRYQGPVDSVRVVKTTTQRVGVYESR